MNGSIPKELGGLTELQVFLMRCNQLSGELIDFSKLTKLRNVWFDTNAGLTGALGGLGQLQGLTFLQASHNPGIGGPQSEAPDRPCTRQSQGRHPRTAPTAGRPSRKRPAALPLQWQRHLNPG